MEGKLSMLLHLVGCRSSASRGSVKPSFSTFVISRPCRKHPGPQSAPATVCRRFRTPSQARPQPLPTAAASGSPTQDVIPARRHTPLLMGSGIPHSSELRLPVLTLQGGAEPEGPLDPRRRTKAAGAAPAGHAHREPRGRASSPPRPRTARNGGRATKWQPAERAGGGVETPVAGHSPVPAVPSPEFGGRPCEDKWSGLAGHPRERSYGRRGSGSPGPPSPPPPRRMPSPRLHFANVPVVVPRPPAPSLAPAGSACRAGRVQLGAASVPMRPPWGRVWRRPRA